MGRAMSVEVNASRASECDLIGRMNVCALRAEAVASDVPNPGVLDHLVDVLLVNDYRLRSFLRAEQPERCTTNDVASADGLSTDPVVKSGRARAHRSRWVRLGRQPPQ